MQDQLICYYYPELVAFTAEGPDAAGYLQARLSNDHARQAIGSTVFSACLTPQGKTEALFQVARISEDKFYLFIGLHQPASTQFKEAVTAGFLRFKVADYFEFTELSAGRLLVQNQPIDTELLAHQNYILAGSLATLHFGLSAKENLPDKPTCSFPEFKQFCYRQGFFEFPDDLQIGQLFPESGLSEVTSYSKGCYAGQEVIERVTALGKLPAQLVAFTGEFNPADAQDLPATDSKICDSSGKAIGTLQSIFADGRRFICSARIKTPAIKELDGGQLHIQGGGDQKLHLELLVSANQN